MPRVVATPAALAAVTCLLVGCGGGSPKPADHADRAGPLPGDRWLALPPAGRTVAARACAARTARGRSARVRERMLRLPVARLVHDLELYYATSVARHDSLPVACSTVLVQQTDAHISFLTGHGRSLRLPAEQRFLHLEGTVTGGAQVRVVGNEGPRPMSVVGRRWAGTIEVEPGRNELVAVAGFNGHHVTSRPLRVIRQTVAGLAKSG